MKFASVVLLATLIVSGCAHKKHANVAPAPPPAAKPRPATSPPPAVAPPVGYIENGIASWYGHPFHGRQAADGEIYDMETLVAAHRTLPFQTWVRVYDLDNNKSVDVRIIDRGPFIDGRIIDLSHAAANAINMVGPGLANVRVEVIGVPTGIVTAVYVVQVGSFTDRAEAGRVRDEMAEHYGLAQVMQRTENPGVWRVLVGHEKTTEAADALGERIRQETGEKKAFTVRLDVQ